jgi:hypothetical protein
MDPIMAFLMIICGVLSFAVVKLSFSNSNLMIDNKSLRSEIENLKNQLYKTKKDKEKITSIDPGDKAIIPNYGLKHISTNESFEVTYEVEILEVSMDKVKVRAIDFTSNDKIGNDPSNRQGILSLMQDKWISKKEIDLVVDDSMRRDVKLKEILGDNY